MPPPGGAWRPSLRAQPARPSRPGADATRSPPVARAAPGNHGHSHRPAGRPVSLVTLCGTATEPEPASLPSSFAFEAPGRARLAPFAGTFGLWRWKGPSRTLTQVDRKPPGREEATSVGF